MTGFPFYLYLCRALSLVSCSSALRAGVVSCTETGTTSPYGGSSLAFCCPGDTEFHQALESNLTTVLFLLYCDISLSGQSDKSHMTSPHERTDRASSRCRRAVTGKKKKRKTGWDERTIRVTSMAGRGCTQCRSEIKHFF